MSRAGLGLLAAVAIATAACGGGGETSASGEPVRTNRVDLPKSYRFDPPAVEIDAGDTVTWTNNDDFPHNVHLLDGSDVVKSLPLGASVEITFDEPGEVPYECSLHPQQMQGRVVVV